MGVVAQIADRVAVLYAGRMVESGPARDVLRNPRHPYTRNLLDAVPTLAGRDGPLAAIPGAAPGFGAAPSGCPFHPRCPPAFARCRAERPQPASDGARTVASICAAVSGHAAQLALAGLAYRVSTSAGWMRRFA
jgi:peptide/nickel transport system ATP-binding protein